jgi:uncharacterized protein
MPKAGGVPDYAGAKAYALKRLARELSPQLVYHSLEHTRDEVLPGAKALARYEGLGEHELLLLCSAALFHDIGFIMYRDNHEEAGVDIAQQQLPAYGYSNTDIKLIRGMIMATKLPQTATTLSEALLADADLSVLGRDNFLARNQALRLESQRVMSDRAWYSSQLAFLESHRYFTEAAQVLLEPKKQENLHHFRKLLATAQRE